MRNEHSHRSALWCATLTALLLCGLILLPAAASANTNGGSIYLNQSLTVNITYAGEYIDLYFTPANSGTYTLESGGSLDTVAELFLQNGTSLASDDDSGSNYNFRLSYAMSGGTTYRYTHRRA